MSEDAEKGNISDSRALDEKGNISDSRALDVLNFLRKLFSQMISHRKRSVTRIWESMISAICYIRCASRTEGIRFVTIGT